MFYVTSRDCVKLAVYDPNPSGCDPILMIHGWPLCGKIFEYQVNMLTQRGYRVITMDLRGYGNSDVPACGYGYDWMADDIYAVVRHMGLSGFTLAGFSMGGAICIRYMGRYHGHGVKKLVLMGAAAPRYTCCEDFPYGVPRESVDQLIAQASMDRAELCESFSHRLLASPHSEAIKNWFRNLSERASGIATILSGYALRDEDCRGDMEKICVPTGIFHGKKDLVVPYVLGEMQQRMICGSVLYPFENSGHGVFYDELPLFNETLLSFLRG